jgi:hypothetical protein
MHTAPLRDRAPQVKALDEKIPEHLLKLLRVVSAGIVASTR